MLRSWVILLKIEMHQYQCDHVGIPIDGVIVLQGVTGDKMAFENLGVLKYMSLFITKIDTSDPKSATFSHKCPFFGFPCLLEGHPRFEVAWKVLCRLRNAVVEGSYLSLSLDRSFEKHVSSCHIEQVFFIFLHSLHIKPLLATRVPVVHVVADAGWYLISHFPEELTEENKERWVAAHHVPDEFLSFEGQS